MDQQLIWDALRTVIDPEVHINIVDMGLVYDLAENDGAVSVTMTLTSPGCPLANQLSQSVVEAVETLPAVRKAEVNLVWDPRWSPAMMTDAARKKMGV